LLNQKLLIRTIQYPNSNYQKSIVQIKSEAFLVVSNEASAGPLIHIWCQSFEPRHTAVVNNLMTFAAAISNLFSSEEKQAA
jgi:hypothetical protein